MLCPCGLGEAWVLSATLATRGRGSKAAALPQAASTAPGSNRTCGRSRQDSVEREPALPEGESFARETTRLERVELLSAAARPVAVEPHFREGEFIPSAAERHALVEPRLPAARLVVLDDFAGRQCAEQHRKS